MLRYSEINTVRFYDLLTFTHIYRYSSRKLIYHDTVMIQFKRFYVFHKNVVSISVFNVHTCTCIASNLCQNNYVQFWL